mmetsp:Transcript_67043/g.120715  ORF Transcript_67043/g.120715 Transcript_67043/m.120715 type:complete len:248 (+) Transcript_67043:428-1171(+)
MLRDLPLPSPLASTFASPFAWPFPSSAAAPELRPNAAKAAAEAADAAWAAKAAEAALVRGGVATTGENVGGGGVCFSAARPKLRGGGGVAGSSGTLAASGACLGGGGGSRPACAERSREPIGCGPGVSGTEVGGARAAGSPFAGSGSASPRTICSNLAPAEAFTSTACGLAPPPKRGSAAKLNGVGFAPRMSPAMPSSTSATGLRAVLYFKGENSPPFAASSEQRTRSICSLVSTKSEGRPTLAGVE